LLEHWTGQQITTGDTDWQSAIQAWKKWYEREFPSETPISAPGESRTGDQWSVSELTAAIVALDGSADVSRGQRLFSTAHCAKCHRYGTVGDSLGPDLTSLAGRFSRVDMIDAMLNPSKHVSDQYRGRKLTLSNGQTVSGLLAPGMNDSLIVLQADGERVKLLAEDVEEISELKQSSMPEGLLDKLSARDVADLIHFLESQPMGRVADNTKSAPSESR